MQAGHVSASLFWISINIFHSLTIWSMTSDLETCLPLSFFIITCFRDTSAMVSYETFGKSNLVLLIMLYVFTYKNN